MAVREPRGPNTVQLDLFPTPSPLSSSALTTPSSALSLIIGLKVRIPQRCRCGGYIAIIGSSNGPHEHRLDCAQCGTWCRWLGARDAAFITKIATTFGCPATPIVIREWRHV
jgi:hypothetical protein